MDKMTKQLQLTPDDVGKVYINHRDDKIKILSYVDGYYVAYSEVMGEVWLVSKDGNNRYGGAYMLIP